MLFESISGKFSTANALDCILIKQKLGCGPKAIYGIQGTLYYYLRPKKNSHEVKIYR